MNEYNPADQKAGIEYADRVAIERFALLGERVTPATKMLMGCAFEAGAAHGRGQVPAGWKLVPEVPTQEQNDAGRAVLAGGAAPMVKVYRAMIAAACAEIQERSIADVWMRMTGPFGLSISIFPSGTDYQRSAASDCLVKFDWFPVQGSAELETILTALERILEEAK